MGKRGFSLMELMVTVVTVGILSTIAMPHYNKMLDRVREAEGIANLGPLLSAQYFHELENGQFTADGSRLLITPPPLNFWTYPGGPENTVWTVTPAFVEIVMTSNHGHADPAAHQLRGRANLDGTFTIEVRRPWTADFGPL